MMSHYNISVIFHKILNIHIIDDKLWTKWTNISVFTRDVNVMLIYDFR